MTGFQCWLAHDPALTGSARGRLSRSVAELPWPAAVQTTESSCVLPTAGARQPVGRTQLTPTVTPLPAGAGSSGRRAGVNDCRRAVPARPPPLLACAPPPPLPLCRCRRHRVASVGRRGN